MTNYQRIRMGMGRTFQTPSVFPELSVVREPPDRRPEPMSRCVPFDHADAVGREGIERKDRRAPRLRQSGARAAARVASSRTAASGLVEIATSLSTEPNLVLLDEPMAGLAEADTSRIMAVIRDLHDAARPDRRSSSSTTCASSSRSRSRSPCWIAAAARGGRAGGDRSANTVVREAYLGKEVLDMSDGASATSTKLNTFYGKSHILRDVGSKSAGRARRAARTQRRRQDDDDAQHPGADAPALR